MNQERARKLIEGKYDTTFWTIPCTCDPKLISTIFGDGRKLFYYTPLMTRPNYYIIRVDSSWIEETFCEREEEILRAIEDDFGNAGDEWDQREFERENQGIEWQKPDWPALHDGGGCYGFDTWPQRVVSKRRARQLRKRGEHVWPVYGTSNRFNWKPNAFGQPQRGIKEFIY